MSEPDCVLICCPRLVRNADWWVGVGEPNWTCAAGWGISEIEPGVLFDHMTGL